MNDIISISKSINNLKQDLAPLFLRFPAIKSAYLFGSTAQGVDSKLSDIDIAVRLNDDVSPELAFDIRMELVNNLEDYFIRKVDVVLLDTASLKLIHQVLRSGRMIFAKELEREMDYAIQKNKEYFDFKYYIDKDIRGAKRYFEADRT
jgi:predicted nucleotidyltransferase